MLRQLKYFSVLLSGEAVVCLKSSFSFAEEADPGVPLPSVNRVGLGASLIEYV